MRSNPFGSNFARDIVVKARVDVAKALVPPIRPILEPRGEEGQPAASPVAPPQGVTDQGFAVAAAAEVNVCHQILELGDALRVIDTDEVAIEMNAANKPAMLKAGSDFLYVLMPVDLN